MSRPLTTRQCVDLLTVGLLWLLLTVACLWGTGCAGNVCLIDAHIEHRRLAREGIKARVALVDTGRGAHAYTVWEYMGEVYYWDAMGSHNTCATNIDDIKALEASWRLFRDSDTRFLAWDGDGDE